MTRFESAAVLVAFAVPLGLLGATAFNPDSGWAARSALLWHLFGGIVEAAIPLFVLLALFAPAKAVVLRRRFP